ncbi:MAG: hypothetical protein K0B37_10160, partial [Bacteroidales bacterium]|nr:hypothetical protein [Bacteroidales bacterium]
MLKIYIRKNTSYHYPVLYTLLLIEKNRGIRFNFTDSADTADLAWDHEYPRSEIISKEFYDELAKENPELSHTRIFKDEQLIRDSSNRKDLIATIFYMVNCLQEYSLGENELDGFGRFRYESSYQKRFSSIEKNLVQQYIDEFCDEKNIGGSPKASAFFISHDIDTIYGSLLQDGYWALKNLRVGAMLSLIAGEIGRRPHWKNMDRIIRINSECDVKSTFFWLVNKGKGRQNIRNADYSIQKEQSLLQEVSEKGFVNGLHKSTMEMSFEEELAMGKIIEPYNRYHFLNFLPPNHWPELSKSPITFDSSLGFAEHYGFRNSYGSAFQPYDIKNNRPFGFVEASLTFMDTTFHHYMKMESEKIADIIINFYQTNPHHCIFSLLWHNTYFTDYKYGGYLAEYKKI